MGEEGMIEWENGGMGEWGRSLRSRSEQWVDYVVSCRGARRRYR